MPLQVAQALLQCYSRNVGQPGGFWLLFEAGQQRGEVLIGKAIARLLIRCAFEAQREIVDPSTASEGASEYSLLFIAWITSIFVGAFDPAHTLSFFLTGTKAETIGTLCSPNEQLLYPSLKSKGLQSLHLRKIYISSQIDLCALPMAFVITCSPSSGSTKTCTPWTPDPTPQLL